MRPQATRLILAILLCTGWLSVATADISVPVSTPEYQPIVATLATSDLPEGARCRGVWECSTASILEVDARTVHVWAAPGKHILVAMGTWVQTEDVDGRPVLVDFGFYRFLAAFTVTGKDPSPDPQPTPTPKAVWALIVEETQERTPAQNRLLHQLRQAYPLHRMLIVDDDAQAPSLRRYIDAIPPEVPEPALIVVRADDTGSIVRIVPLPTTLEGFQKEMGW